MTLTSKDFQSANVKVTNCDLAELQEQLDRHGFLLLSESVLAREWNSPEENDAWAEGE